MKYRRCLELRKRRMFRSFLSLSPVVAVAFAVTTISMTSAVRAGPNWKRVAPAIIGGIVAYKVLRKRRRAYKRRRGYYPRRSHRSSVEMRRRFSRRELMMAQESLAVLGFYSKAIDGVPGPGTRRAVQRYQREMGQPQTGVLNYSQFNSLLALRGRESNPRRGLADSRREGRSSTSQAERRLWGSDDRTATWSNERHGERSYSNLPPAGRTGPTAEDGRQSPAFGTRIGPALPRTTGADQTSTRSDYSPSFAPAATIYPKHNSSRPSFAEPDDDTGGETAPTSPRDMAGIGSRSE